MPTENFTRFYILAQGLEVALPEKCSLETQGMGLLRLQAPPGSLMLNIPGVLNTLDLTVLRIDRRPSLYAIPFHDAYFIEVSANSKQNDCGQLWKTVLQQAVDNVRAMGTEVSVLGLW